MDEESGVTRSAEVELVVTQAKKPVVNDSWNKKTYQPSEASDVAQSVRLLAGKNVQRPQLMFKDKIDNSSKPWCPRIKDKPNSLKPLAIYLEESENGEVFNHPYEYELDMFKLSDDRSIYKVRTGKVQTPGRNAIKNGRKCGRHEIIIRRFEEV